MPENEILPAEPAGSPGEEEPSLPLAEADAAVMGEADTLEEIEEEAVEEIGVVEKVSAAPVEETRSRYLAPEELVRAGLAFAFVVIFAATIGFAFTGVDEHWASTKELVELLLPAETALLGSAVGFYFGTRQQ
jgi:hypothetical protein